MLSQQGVTRGSRRHILEWVSRPTFSEELRALLTPVPVDIGPGSQSMPKSEIEREEARLDVFGRSWMPEHPAWEVLANWWLAHRRGANTPNWDLAIGCRIEGIPFSRPCARRCTPGTRWTNAHVGPAEDG